MAGTDPGVLFRTPSNGEYARVAKEAWKRSQDLLAKLHAETDGDPVHVTLILAATATRLILNRDAKVSLGSFIDTMKNLYEGVRRMQGIALAEGSPIIS